MLEQHVKIGAGGRLVLPAQYRKALHIHEGDELILSLQDGELRLFQQARALQNLRDAAHKKQTSSHSATEDFLVFRKNDAGKE